MSLSPTPARAEMAPPSLAGLAGDSGSKEAIARLTRDCAGSRTKVERKVANLLRSALRSIAAQDFAEASRQAIAALNLDERQGLAWHVLAIAQEKAGHDEDSWTAIARTTSGPVGVNLRHCVRHLYTGTCLQEIGEAAEPCPKPAIPYSHRRQRRKRRDPINPLPLLTQP